MGVRVVVSMEMEILMVRKDFCAPCVCPGRLYNSALLSRRFLTIEGSFILLKLFLGPYVIISKEHVDF